MSSVITFAGENYIADRQANALPVVVDHFVLANVPGLDPEVLPDRNNGLPAAQYIIGDFDIEREGYDGSNGVIYTLELDSTQGDYDFNFIAAITDTGVPIAITHAFEVKKRAGVQQILTRNMLMKYENAQALTGITVPAETWQFDYVAEMTSVKSSVYAIGASLMMLHLFHLEQNERIEVLQESQQ